MQEETTSKRRCGQCDGALRPWHAGFCSEACYTTHREASLHERLWSHIDQSGECWLWTGGRTKLGYGRVGSGGKMVYAHRLVYELTHGPVPLGMVVCHRCDTPSCCRPEHLFAAPQRDNMQDALRKGRMLIPRQRHRETMPLSRRLWSKVDRSGGAEACWPWKGALLRNGYGQIGVGGMDGGVIMAHRAAWAVTNGAIPEGMHILHRCDNPRCCNPAHLFLGTRSDNMRDMVAKGRAGSVTHPERVARGDQHWAARYPERYGRGERHWNAKLTEAQVREIRERHAAGGVSMAALARRYGVTDVLISAIVKRKSWRHVE